MITSIKIQIIIKFNNKTPQISDQQFLFPKIKPNITSQQINPSISQTNYVINILMLSQIIPKLSYRLHTITAPSIDIHYTYNIQPNNMIEYIHNLSRYINRQDGWQNDCKIVSQSLHRYGLVYAKDDRFDQHENERFLDLMQRYYATRSYQFDKGLKGIDVVQSDMPIGLKHAYLQIFNTYKEDKSLLQAPHLSMTTDQPQPDPTWRFHWIIGSKKNVIPTDFQEFEGVMNTWGNSLKNCGLIIAEMAAIGLNLDKDIFSSKIKNGDQYFSPTGTDLLKSTKDKVLCSFHRDFDLLTIHGKSRYAGLYAWLNTGQKFNVVVPEGHMLIQGGKQLEWLTGGHIKAGFHEVVHNQHVESAKQDAIRRGKWPWRVSSTLFCQAQLSQSLKPLQPFLSDEVLKRYPDITAYEYIQRQLAELIHQ